MSLTKCVIVHIKKSENLASTPDLKRVASPRHHFLMLCVRCVHAVPELEVVSKM